MTDKRLGRQTPTISVVLPYTESIGCEAAEIYNRSKRNAQPWQELMLEDIMAVNDDGTFVHMKFGWSIPRRNGKSEILIMRAIWGVVNGRRVLYTAHRTTTSSNAWSKCCDRLAEAGYIEGIGKSKSPEIPSTLGGVPIRVIERTAFADNTDIKAVKIPEGTEVIE